MSDPSLNYFVARGTAAERGAFTPDEPTPAGGPDPGYYFYETDTGALYAWDGAAWDKIASGVAASSTDNAIARYDGTAGKLQDSAITIGDTGALTFPDNIRQTFNPGADAAGLNVGAVAGDPGTPVNGDLWYDSTANELTARINGANVALGAGGGSYTDEEAQDAVGAMIADTATIDLTYTDGTPELKADVKDGSITYAKLQDASATSRILARVSSGAGDWEEGTPAQIRTMLHSGCMATKTADETAANYTTAAAIPWDAEAYDDNSFHDPVTNNSRLTVPSGVTRVRLTANVFLSSVTGNLTSTIVIRKNGSADFDGAAAMSCFSEGTSRFLSASSGPVPVTAGDYFEVWLSQVTDTSITIDDERSNFSIEVLQG